MIWLVGIAGFIVGFSGGVVLLRRWLRDKTQEELMTDKSLHRTYGLFVWFAAGVTAFAAIWLYRYYF
jgi:hypothetical protein